MLVEPAAEAWDGRQGRERGQVRQLGAELLDDLFDQEVAERYAGESLVAVGDRIEDRGIGLGRVEPIERMVEQWWEVAADASGQGDLDEDERLAEHAGVEERIAPAP